MPEISSSSVSSNRGTPSRVERWIRGCDSVHPIPSGPLPSAPE
jgi:hypothetical protein